MSNWQAPEHANIPSPLVAVEEALALTPQPIIKQLYETQQGTHTEQGEYLDNENYAARTVVNLITPFRGAPKVFWTRDKEPDGAIHWTHYDFRKDFPESGEFNEVRPAHNDSERVAILCFDSQGRWFISNDVCDLYWDSTQTQEDHIKRWSSYLDGSFEASKPVRKLNKVIEGREFLPHDSQEQYVAEKRYKDKLSNDKADKYEARDLLLKSKSFDVRNKARAHHRAKTMKRGRLILLGLISVPMV